jgi:hypothetical protein
MNPQARIVALQQAMRDKGFVKADAWLMVRAGSPRPYSVSIDTHGDAAFDGYPTWWKSAPTIDAVLSLAEEAVRAAPIALAKSYAADFETPRQVAE